MTGGQDLPPPEPQQSSVAAQACSPALAAVLAAVVLTAIVSDCGDKCAWHQLRHVAAMESADELPLCRDRVALGPLVSVNVSDNDDFPFRPQSCRFRHWDTLSAQTCLRGRQVFVIGNSVAREFYGHVVAQMCEQARDRVGEKLVCKADLGFCSKRCDGSLDAEFGMTFAHFFTNRMGDPLPPGYRYHDKDKCPYITQECISLVLRESKPGDVLIFFAGVSLAWEFKHITSAEAGNETAMRLWARGTGNGAPHTEELPRFDNIVNAFGARMARPRASRVARPRGRRVPRQRRSVLCYAQSMRQFGLPVGQLKSILGKHERVDSPHKQAAGRCLRRGRVVLHGLGRGRQ